MTNQPATSGSTLAAVPKTQEHTQTVEGRKALMKDIHVKWNKFSEQEVDALKSNEDLVDQLVTKYGLAKDAAQRDADTLRAGRNI